MADAINHALIGPQQSWRNREIVFIGRRAVIVARDASFFACHVSF
jgi:hypothetical protein